MTDIINHTCGVCGTPGTDSEADSLYLCKNIGASRLDYRLSRATSPRSHRATPMCRARPGLGCQEACSSVSPALRSK